MIENIDSTFEKYSDEWLIANYLKYGSVEAVFAAYKWSIPFSIADYHRKIKKAGIIKGDGRSNKSIAGALYFFANRALNPELSLEKIYRSQPISMRDAQMSSIYRIYDAILKNKTRRFGVGAVITPEYDRNMVLIADERTTSAVVGKTEGDATIPFGFASRNISFSDSILRVLQREFSSGLTIKGELVKGSEMVKQLTPANLKPFLEIQLLDVRVKFAHLVLPLQLCDLKCCSSFTVKNHRFTKLEDLLDGQVQLRSGMNDVFVGYRDYLLGVESLPISQISALNLSLLASV